MAGRPEGALSHDDNPVRRGEAVFKSYRRDAHMPPASTQLTTRLARTRATIGWYLDTNYIAPADKPLQYYRIIGRYVEATLIPNREDAGRAMLSIDSDRPITDAKSDEYGFADMAAKLAPSIAALANGDSIVFGIEGPWGSGKTSFLNFLRPALEGVEGVNVITLAPWLIGDSRSLVGALMASMIPALEALEAKSESKKWFTRKEKVIRSADLLRGYAVKTGRGLAPLAKLAGLLVPGAAAVGDALEIGTSALEVVGGTKGETELKDEIAKRIGALNARFVVLIDDLDRLEPAQAVEVIRLIRSVADFPNVAYLLCFDRSILAHALEIGLSVQDGDLFLQKIIQLSFTLPLPEPFDMRISLRRKLLELYKSVTGQEILGEESSDFMSAIDRQGSGLRTPRDVKLVLNGIAFVFPSIASDVYFPDLCRIHLIKILNPRLYQLIEEYLGLRSALVVGDAHIDKSEREHLGERLGELLPDSEIGSSKSIWSIRSFVPGVVKVDRAAERVFQSSSRREVEDMVTGHRLGSPLHSRFYFALNASRAVIKEADMEKLRIVAGGDVSEARKIVGNYIANDRDYGQSWFEHLLVRLDEVELSRYSFDQLAGLARALASTAGVAANKYRRVAAFTVSVSSKIEAALERILVGLKKLDRDRTASIVSEVVREGDPTWLVGHFYRQQLFDSGKVGDRAKPASQRALSDAEMDDGRKILESRIEQASDHFLEQPDFGAFIFGWRDMSGIKPVKTWVDAVTKDDEGFVEFLLGMRSWAVSDKVYYPLQRNDVELFMPWDQVVQRLDQLEAAGADKLRERIAIIREAIAHGRNGVEEAS